MSETQIEVSEAESIEAPAAPTVEEAKAGGLSAKELEMAEKQGLLAPEAKAKESAEVKPEVKAEATEKPKSSGLPDMVLTPEKEAEFVKAFGPGTPQHGLYFRMKTERRQRQAAEARIRELEALQAPKPAPVEGEDDDAPLTPKRLREIQQRDAEEFARLQQEDQQRHATLSSAQKDQEDYVRSLYPDFDHAIKMATDIKANFETLFPEKRMQTKVAKLYRDLQEAAAKADKFSLDDEHAAFIAYELGKMHPQYGQAPTPEKTGTSTDPKPTGGTKPEQLKRVEANTQRRTSSASVPTGGGKRTISADDVDLAALNAMQFKERAAFKKEHPVQYAKAMRG